MALKDFQVPLDFHWAPETEISKVNTHLDALRINTQNPLYSKLNSLLFLEKCLTKC